MGIENCILSFGYHMERTVSTEPGRFPSTAAASLRTGPAGTLFVPRLAQPLAPSSRFTANLHHHRRSCTRTRTRGPPAAARAPRRPRADPCPPLLAPAAL